jgi:flagellar motor switch protein FliM
MSILYTLELKVKDAESMLNICMPYETIRKYKDSFKVDKRNFTKVMSYEE